MTLRITMNDDILSDYDLREAVRVLRWAGFRTFVFEKGTIGAYKNGNCLGFAPRHGRYGREAITRAVALK